MVIHYVAIEKQRRYKVYAKVTKTSGLFFQCLHSLVGKKIINASKGQYNANSATDLNICLGKLRGLLGEATGPEHP